MLIKTKKMKDDIKNIKKSNPELSDMMHWWTKDGGIFNVDLYIKICVIKAQQR